MIFIRVRHRVIAAKHNPSVALPNGFAYLELGLYEIWFKVVRQSD